jgi:hypothetical protein
MTTCTLCSRYGLTTEAIDTREIEGQHYRYLYPAPVCAACAEQIDLDTSRQRQIAAMECE